MNRHYHNPDFLNPLAIIALVIMCILSVPVIGLIIWIAT